jgi:hypothetical protein
MPGVACKVWCILQLIMHNASTGTWLAAGMMFGTASPSHLARLPTTTYETSCDQQTAVRDPAGSRTSVATLQL